MKDSWISQYEMIQSARAVLLTYCDTILPAHFTMEVPGFGRGSIRNLLVHNGHVYMYWMGEHAMGRAMEYPEYRDISTVQECREYYMNINDLADEFIRRFAAMPAVELNSIRKNKVVTATALEVFTHVITHEFHHKGQMLSISRHMGYTPVDTDVIR